MVSMLWATASTSLILLNKHILSDLDFPYPLFLGWCVPHAMHAALVSERIWCAPRCPASAAVPGVMPLLDGCPLFSPLTLLRPRSRRVSSMQHWHGVLVLCGVVLRARLEDAQAGEGLP
jgi:hypothetical protein